MSFATIRRHRPLWLVILVMVIAALAITNFARAEPPAPRQATVEQQDAFIGLWKQYQRLYFDASVTGDVSAYPTLFTNDPTFDLAKFDPDCVPLVEAERASVDDRLRTIKPEDVGETGLLSCMIAEQISYHRNVDAWQAAQAEAAAKGVEPSGSDLPAGLRPMDPTNPEGWTDDPIYIIDAVVQGENQAQVTYAGIPKESKPGLFFNIAFTRINEQWYISGIWSSGEEYGL